MIATNSQTAKWLVLLLGAVLALVGILLAGGGVWLIRLGGSPYYLVAGLGLLASGILIMQGRLAGAWVYAAIFALTVIWSFWEVGGGDGWALVPRLVAPIVLLLFVIAATPVLKPLRVGWREAMAGIAACLVIAIGGGLVISAGAGQSFDATLPAPGSMAMNDPSPMAVGQDWPAYGGTYSARRYSPLAQINADNVGQLKRAWTMHTGDLPHSAFTKEKYGAETTPLKVGDTLYLCTPKNIMIALDPETGKQRWRYDPKVDDKFIPYTAACRGVSYYKAPQADASKACAARIVEGTLDARLIEVDAATGEPCADFGQNGQVDTTIGMGKVVPGMISITSAPTIVRGVVVVGHQILDGQRRDAPSGVIEAYDVVTGAMKWAWDMKKPDLHGLPPEGQTYSLGTPNMWTTASGDDALGLVYLPLGNTAADYLSRHRSDLEKQYSSSLVALNIETGKPAWVFQAVRDDVWDYDLGSQATLVDFPTAQGTVPALILPGKQGDLYVLDRRTGTPLSGVEERAVAGGGVEPEQRAPMQRFSLYNTLRKADLTEKEMWGMTPLDQMICRIQFKGAHYTGFYTAPTTDRHYIEYPGYNGGSDWGGIAVDPDRGVIIANYNDMPNYNRLVPRAQVDKLGWLPRGEGAGGLGGAEGAGDPQVGTPYGIAVNAGWRLAGTGLLCKEPPYGGIRAIDLKTGHTIWDRPLGTARMNGPFGIPSMLPISIGTPNNGGAVVTAGGLIFIAAATDNLIRAIDIKTGKTVWTDVLPAGGQATPMTYEENGRQYVVIMAGGHHFMETRIGDELIAYALPKG